MRRMREQFWQVFLFALSIVVLTIGIGLYVKKRHVLTEAAHSGKKSNRDVASEGKQPGSEKTSEETKEAPSAQEEVSHSPQEPSDLLPDSTSVPLEREARVNENDLCKNVEYQGDGFQNTQVSREDWNQVVNQFHEAKKLLKTWLNHTRKKFPEKAIAFMESQLENLKIVQPPSIDEPDLSWRGIGVWTRDEKNEPLVRLSGGFIKWVVKQPKRTLFEMTRLVAQSWAPCELRKVDAASIWDSTLKCLDVVDDQSCGAGSYSEGGWAVSSSLAYVLSPPGCKLPAFNKSKKNNCLAQLSVKPEAKTEGKPGVKSEEKSENKPEITPEGKKE